MWIIGTRNRLLAEAMADRMPRPNHSEIAALGPGRLATQLRRQKLHWRRARTPQTLAW